MEHLKGSVRILCETANPSITPLYDADENITAEKLLLTQAWMDSFLSEVKALKAKWPIHADRHLSSVSPEYDEITRLIRVVCRQSRFYSPVHSGSTTSQHEAANLIPSCFILDQWASRAALSIGFSQAINTHLKTHADVPKTTDLPPCSHRSTPLALIALAHSSWSMAITRRRDGGLWISAWSQAAHT